MENKFKIRAVIYARVSTIEQAKKDTSIPQQIEACTKAIIEHGWDLVHEPYKDEGISGHLLEERHGLQALLEDARQHKFDLVVVKDFDRFARNRAAATIVREELKELFVQTYALNTPVTPKDPKAYDPTDDDLAIMVEGFSDAQSEIERNKIRRRMMMGKDNVAKKGDIPNNVPYGYKIVRWYDDKEKKVKRRVEIDEDEAKNVKWIFDQYIKGTGALNIAFQLTEKKVKPPRGQFWRAQAIKYILQNRTYTGRVLWGWRHADYKKNKQRKVREHKGLIIENGSHGQIIPDPIFQLAQKEKALRGKTQNGRAQMSRGLLTGIAKCIRCGSGVTYLTRHHNRAKKNPKWNNTTTFEYLCGGYKYSGICQRRVMSATRLEDFVINQIRNLINNPTARERLFYDRNLEITDGMQADYDYAAKQLREIERKRKRVKDAYEAGIDSLEVYAANIKRLDDEEKQYHVVADDYKNRLQQLNERRQTLEKFTSSLEEFEKLWGTSDFQEKKHFLRTLVKEIKAGNGQVVIDFRF